MSDNDNERKLVKTTLLGRNSVTKDEDRQTLVIVPMNRLPDPRNITSKEQATEVVSDVENRQATLQRVFENLFPGQRAATFVFTTDGQPLLYVSDMPRVVMADLVTGTIVGLMEVDQASSGITEKPPTDSVH